MLNGLDLFSGIGGISLALREYVRPIAYCEIDPYCQGVLLSKMVSGELLCAPICDDIRTFQCTFMPLVDIIYGGFPCQDISVAGHGKGLAGQRSGLFFEILRLAKEIKPRFIFLENVPAITSRGGLQVVREIAQMGYDCRWCVISAASVGAMHKRERWFLLGYAKHNGLHGIEERGSTKKTVSNNEKRQDKTRESKGTGSSGMLASESLAKSSSERLEGFSMPGEQEKPEWGRNTRVCWPFESVEHWQETVSEMGKCSDGISDHVARLRSLGNAVVPQQVKKAFEILIGIDPLVRKEEVRE